MQDNTGKLQHCKECDDEVYQDGYCQYHYTINAAKDAVDDANYNKELNNATNCTYKLGKVENLTKEITSEYDTAIIDPPRSGLDKKVVEKLLEIKPKTLIYVSCDPVTLARDLNLLKEKYNIEYMRPYNMFPRTYHVETVCLLSKLHSDQHIEVEVKMDELDLTAAESKATYEEIKKYVLEHTGLKVSNLYIAQVKQKCGIIERVNYNLPKSENSRQPKCPPEKEKAIKEALEYFRMI